MNYDWLEVMIGLEVAIGLRTKDLNIFTLHFAKLRSLDRSNKVLQKIWNQVDPSGDQMRAKTFSDS